MLYILDTDTCSYIIKDNNENIKHNLIVRRGSSICTSAITRAELMFGVAKKRSEKITSKVKDFLRMIDVIPFDSSAADVYATLRRDLESSGDIIGNMDLLIASCAIANNAILVTNNTKHFSKIDNLEVQNWLQISR